MSLLGFDALGRLALGQLPGAHTTTVLTVTAGSFAMTGQAATFKVLENTAAGVFLMGTVTDSFFVDEAASAGAFAFTGVAAAFKIIENPTAGAYTINGNAVTDRITEFAQAGAFVLTGKAAVLSYTGAQFDLVYGGIGHFLYEQERARQLAKITRKTPQPIDRRTAPTFEPIGSPPAAPIAPAIDLAAVQNQRMGEAAAAAMQTKKRRELEAILLLAS